MSCLNKELGKEGENLAVEYLKEQGYEIIARNVTMGKNGEIDIIALKDDIYAFVEVRSRSTDDYIDPESTIT
ncbi:MAG: YraN family protein, partial [Ignavibacteria bacterium]|nr:YraN family protein [Ignavibacteria bacterium]